MTDERNLSIVSGDVSTSSSNQVNIEITNSGSINPEPINIPINSQIKNYVIGSPLANYRVSPPKIDKEDECYMYGLIPCLFVIVISLIAAIVAYLVFGIMYLVEDKDINDECNSEIWAYVITIVISSFLSGGFSTRTKKEKETFRVYLIFWGLIFIWLGTWGIILYSQETCEALKNSNIYTWTQVSSIFTTILGSIKFIAGVILCIYN